MVTARLAPKTSESDDALPDVGREKRFAVSMSVLYRVRFVECNLHELPEPAPFLDRSRMSLVRELATLLCQHQGRSLSPTVDAAATNTLLNVVGTAIGASHHPAVDMVVAAARAERGSADPAAVAAVLGRTELLSPPWAALANGLAAHVDDFDDTHLATVIHPGAATLAALLATAQERRLDGRRALNAFALGVEAQLRVGIAMSPSHYDAGWHITGTCGVVGAAVTVALARGLDERAVGNAIAIATTLTLGHREPFGTMVKAFHPGQAAANGITAALLAEHGATAPDEAFEATTGYFAAMATDWSTTPVLDRFGERWHLLDNTFKPYPCGIVSHPGIDAAVALHARLADQLDRVETVELICNPLVPELTGNLTPTTGLEARFSTAHGVAAGLVFGRAGIPQYDDAVVVDPAVSRVRAAVRLAPDGDCPRDSAVLHVTTDDGTTLTETVEHARGSLARPLTDAELHDKFDALVEPVLPGRAGVIRSAVAALATADSIAALIAAATPDADDPSAEEAAS